MGTLYLLTFPNGKSYVGQTRRTLAVRWAQHRNVAKRGVRASALYAAWAKHGEPSCRLLGEYPDEELSQLEIEWIAAFGTLAPQGYNVTPGGEQAPTLVASVAAKVSRALTGKRQSNSHRQANAAAQKSSPKNAAVRAQMADARRGMTLSPEWVGRIGAASKRHWQDPAYRERTTAARRSAAKGPEVKARRSEMMRRRWAENPGWRAKPLPLL